MSTVPRIRNSQHFISKDLLQNHALEAPAYTKGNADPEFFLQSLAELNCNMLQGSLQALNYYQSPRGGFFQARQGHLPDTIKLKDVADFVVATSG